MCQKCIVWGAGSYGKRLMGMLTEELGYSIIAYCDINKGLISKCIDRYEIISIDKAAKLCKTDPDIVVIIGIFDYKVVEEVKEIIKIEFPANTRVETGHDIQDIAENRTLQRYHQHMSFRWDIDLEECFLQWLDNIMSEVEYWVRDVASPQGERYGYNEKCRGNDKFTHKRILKTVKGKETVLDIGCGLVSQFGELLDNGDTVNLIPVDALAPFYNNINDKIHDGRKKDYICRFGMFEFLGNLFAEGYADYIIINNALDHCVDPWRSLVECLYVLKKDGHMFLRHRRAEAVYEDWSGLHKWNIDCRNGELVIWNMENAINVTRELESVAKVYVKYDDSVSVRENQIIDAEIVKKMDFELAHYFDMRKENIVLSKCIGKLMEKLSMESASFLSMLKNFGL